MSTRDIVKKDPADFTPTLGNYTDLQPFRFWCQKVLPLVYDDSLSYYELLCKVVDYLNKTMEDVGVLEGDVTGLHEAYKKLQGYVNDYFSTLDVQEEINNKLDAMAKDGSLTELIKKYVDPFIDTQNKKIGVLEERMNTFAKLPDGSTTADAELIDIRVPASGFNGVGAYPTAGDAVRGQINILNGYINNVATKHINYLLPLTRITGKFYNHKSTTIATAAENVKTEIYNGIPINAGVTYYYKNLYTYFCNIVYNDGTIVALSETSNSYQDGSFIAEKNGKILITVNLKEPTRFFIFTDDALVNKYYYNFKDNVYEPNELRSLFVEPLYIQKTNYANILPDCDTAKNNSVYRLVFSKNETNFPKNTPYGNSYGTSNETLFMCFGKTKKEVSIADYQLFFSSEAIYKRQYSARLSSDGATYEYYWNDWEIVGQKNETKTVIVDKSGNGDYTSLLDGILYATKYMDSVIYVKGGEYDLVSEFEEHYGSNFFTNYSGSDIKGIILKNRVTVNFDSNAKVTFNYTGNNTEVKSIFSPFNSGVYGFTLNNLNLKASNCRYNIHDEMASVTDGYQNIYKNCSLYLDNSKNDAWKSKQCIGGGLGVNGNIIVENCIFESIGINENGYAIVSWHNSASSTAKSNIVITGNYFKGKGTFRLSWYGTSTKITYALVSNNSLGSAIQSRAETSDGTSPNINTNIIEWNNVIRTN